MQYCQWLWQLRRVPDETVYTTCVKQTGQDILWEPSCKQLLELLMSCVLLSRRNKWQPASAFTVKTLNEQEIHQEMIILSRTCPLMLLWKLEEFRTSDETHFWGVGGISSKGHSSLWASPITALIWFWTLQTVLAHLKLYCPAKANYYKPGWALGSMQLHQLDSYFLYWRTWMTNLTRMQKKGSREVVWGKRNEN